MTARFDPVAFSFGNFEFHWYGLMYLVGFAEFRLEQDRS